MFELTVMDLACAINSVILDLLNIRKLGYNVSEALETAFKLEATLPLE